MAILAAFRSLTTLSRCCDQRKEILSMVITVIVLFRQQTGPATCLSAIAEIFDNASVGILDHARNMVGKVDGGGWREGAGWLGNGAE